MDKFDLFNHIPLRCFTGIGKSYDLPTAPPLQWHHNERDGVSNNRRLDCLLHRLFRRRSKRTPKLRITGLCGHAHSMRPWVTSFCIEKHVKQTFPVDTYHHKLNHEFYKKKPTKNRPFRNHQWPCLKNGMLTRYFNIRGVWNLIYYRKVIWTWICETECVPRPLTHRNCKTYFRFSEVKCVIVLYWLLVLKIQCYPVIKNSTEKYFHDWWWKTKVKIYPDFWLYACMFLLCRFSRFHSHCCQCMHVVPIFWVLSGKFVHKTGAAAGCDVALFTRAFKSRTLTLYLA